MPTAGADLAADPVGAPPPGRGVIPAAANGWSHRPHLDGLRAIAVYLVVLFHARMTSFEGGFIGVDLFFVLSGFLVTNVMLSDFAEHGHLRFLRFYARRARRLIPAATVAVVGTVLGALLVTAPLDREKLIDDARAASLWFANWHFIAEAQDYFNADDAESPFLHFWSLAIEEQFYIVFPLALAVLWRLSRSARSPLRPMSVAVGVALVGGVVLQIATAGDDANRAYLATDTRVYQLLVGVLIALVLWQVRIPQRGRAIARLLSVLGVVALVVASSSILDVTASNRGLVGAFLAGATIVAFEWSRGGPMASVLSTKPLRYLGNISYGTYLWHWPIIVFAERVGEVSSPGLLLLSGGLGTACAALSHELVEQPIRRGRWLDGRAPVAVAGGVGLACVAGLVVAPALLQRDSPPALRVDRSVVIADVADVGESVDDESGPSTVAVRPGPVPELEWTEIGEDIAPGAPCREADGSDCLVVEGDAGLVFLVGDSHARMWTPAWITLAERYGFSLALSSAGSCPWPNGAYLGTLDWNRAQACVDHDELVYGSQIDALQPDLVVMASNGNRIRENLVLNSSRSDITAPGHEALLDALVRSTVADLRDRGYPIVLIEPVNILDADPLACLSAARDLSECVFQADDATFEEEIYRDIAASDDAVWSVDVDPLICDPLGRCPAIIDGIVVRRDNNHLTPPFAASLAETIDDQLDVSLLGALTDQAG